MSPNQNKLKIALIRKRYTAFGGAERIIDRTIEALRQYNADITLVSQSWQGEAPCNTHICNPFAMTRTGRDKRFARAACEHINASNYDLVQSHERISCCDIFRAGDGLHHSWLEQRKRGVSPAQRFAIDINPYHRYMLKAEKEMFSSPRLKAVICNSELIKDEIQHYFGLAEEKLHVIYNGVDTNKFHPSLKKKHRDKIRAQLGLDDDSLLMLYIGSGFERKGVPTLLQTMALLPSHCHLVIVGKDKKLKEYQNKSIKAELGKRIHFTGPASDVTPYLGAADIFVLPTLYDPFANVILEAMASGLPAITSTKCGAVDIIKTGVNGFICDSLDIEMLKQQITMLFDIETRKAIGAAARRTVEPMSTEKMGQQLFTLYQNLLQQTGAITASP